MKLSRWSLLTTVLGIWAALGVVYMFMDQFASHTANAPNRVALMQIHKAIRIGSPYTEVLEAYWRYSTDRTQIYSNDPDKWRITMPREFSAHDWKLDIGFKNGAVSSVRIRPNDGMQPEDAPKDKGCE